MLSLVRGRKRDLDKLKALVFENIVAGTTRASDLWECCKAEFRGNKKLFYKCLKELVQDGLIEKTVFSHKRVYYFPSSYLMEKRFYIEVTERFLRIKRRFSENIEKISLLLKPSNIDSGFVKTFIGSMLETFLFLSEFSVSENETFRELLLCLRNDLIEQYDKLIMKCWRMNKEAVKQAFSEALKEVARIPK